MARTYQCYLCKKYSSDVVVAYIDGDYRIVCTRCFLSYVLHETIKEMLEKGSEDDIRHVVRVLEGINDLVEDNPFAQAIERVIDEWARKHPNPLFIEDLEKKWRYRLELDRVIEYLVSEEIFVKASLAGREALVPGRILGGLLKRFPSSKGFFRDVVRAVTGLAVVRYLSDPNTRKFRKIYATLQAILECIEDGGGEPYYEVKGYKCRLCGDTFSSKTEVKQHLLTKHSHEITCDLDDEVCFNEHVSEIRGRELGVWCKYKYFVKKAGVYGISRMGRYTRYLLTKGAIIPLEGDEVFTEREGEKYVAVDIAWVRVRERMRAHERALVRTR